MGFWSKSPGADESEFGRAGSISRGARAVEDQAGECYSGITLLQSARAASGNVPAIGWICATRRSAVRRRKTDEIHAGAKKPLSPFMFCGDRVFLSAGIFAVRGA